MFEIKVPDFGESIIEGTISKWLKKEGDYVSEGEAIVEIETEKVNVDISADQGGRLETIFKKDGEDVQVGEVIAHLKQASEQGAVPPEQQQAAPTTDEASPSKEASESSTESLIGSTSGSTSEASSSSSRSYLASPSARREARERNLDLEKLQSNDPIGRLSKQDVTKSSMTNSHADALENSDKTEGSKQHEESKQHREAKQPKDSSKDAQQHKPADRIRMSRRRQTIAKHLVQAQQTAAMLTTFNEVDMSAVLDLRNRKKEEFLKKHGVKLGFMSFFTKAVIGALKDFPLLNAEIDGDDMIVKHYYDIGIAVSTDEGLVVPIVQNADRLGFAGIEKEIGQLAEKAQNQKLSLQDIQGGTFTITNGGVFGSLLSTPILNTPQVGILGMHTIQNRPVAIDETRMENRPMMYIALSYDHRIVDGSEAVKFLVKVKQLLEDPENLLIEG